MKVAFLGRYNDGDILSGPEKVAVNLFREMSALAECRFYTYFFDGNIYGLADKVIGKEASHDGNVLKLGAARMIADLISFKPDVIHIINYERFAVISRYVKSTVNCRIVYTVHGVAAHENEHFKNVSDEYKNRDKIIERKIFKMADRLAFLSEQSADIAGEYYEVAKEKSAIVPNGIEAEFRERWIRNYEDEELKIVFAGESSRPEKGFAILKEAMKSTDPSIEYFVNRNDNVSEQSNLISFHPMNTKSYSEFLADKHVLALPSLYEPFSLAAAEAMASGLAVVVSSNSGISRFIEHGINGFIAIENTPEEFAGYINLLNTDRELLKKVSVNAGNISEELDWKKIALKYLDLYK